MATRKAKKKTAKQARKVARKVAAKKPVRKAAKKAVGKAAKKSIKKTAAKKAKPAAARKAKKIKTAKPKKKVAAKKPSAKKPAPKKPAPKAAKKSTAKPAPKPKAAQPPKPAKPSKPKKSAYKPGAGEKYMNQRQKRYFREVLRGMLTSIRVNSEKTIDSLKDDVSAIPDDNDRASKEAEFTLELRERERERRLKQKIDHAIRRIDKGEFGFCEECGEKIGIERLVARPVAVYCFECKQLQERREKTGN